MNELRTLARAGVEWHTKLQSLSKRSDLSEIKTVRVALAQFLEEVKEAEEAIKKRVTELRRTRIRQIEDVERLLAEAQALVIAYDQLPTDQEDLLLIQRLLRALLRHHRQLEDESLSWGQFEQNNEQRKAGKPEGRKNPRLPSCIPTFLPS